MRDSLRNRPYKLPRSSPYRSLRLVSAIFVLALLLVVADQGGLLGPVRSQVQTWISPALGTLRRVGDGVNGVGQSLSEVQQLRDRVAALEQENSRLKAEKDLAIVPGASHLFEEPGTLQEAARLAANWFSRHFGGR